MWDTLEGVIFTGVMGWVTWSRLENRPHEPRWALGAGDLDPVSACAGAEPGRGDCISPSGPGDNDVRRTGFSSCALRKLGMGRAWNDDAACDDSLLWAWAAVSRTLSCCCLSWLRFCCAVVSTRCCGPCCWSHPAARRENQPASQQDTQRL